MKCGPHIAGLNAGPLVLGAAIALWVTSGCDSMGKAKVDNPVMGPPPPRISMPAAHPSTGQAFVSDSQNHQTAEDRSAGAAADGIVPISMSSDGQARGPQGSPSNALLGSEVVAVVNGSPIFAYEVLERYGSRLAEAQKQMPPQEFEKLRLALIERDLKNHVERRIVVSSLRSTLKPEQLKMLQEHLEKAFETEVDRLKQELKVNSKHELEAELQKQGTSLANLRDAFVNQRMAREYLGAKAQSKQKIGRQELLEYYQAHLSDYLLPGRVKWQQIQISFSKHGGQRQALEVLNQAIEELRRGEDFGVVARKYSNGPTALQNGHWDWTQAGSFADERVEQELFQLPIGKISKVLEDGVSYQLLLVTDRREAGRTPFEEVQAEIQKTLEQTDRQEAINDVLDDLVATAVVNTIFDKTPPESPPERPDSPVLPFE